MSNNNNNNNKNKAIMENTAATRLASVLNKAEKMGFNRLDTLNLINEYYVKGQDIESMVLRMNDGKFSAKLFVEVLYA